MTVTVPVFALPPMLKVAVIVVALTTLRLVTVTPVGALTVAPEIKPLPVNVTGTVAPCAPPAGLIEDSVGTGGLIVNVWALLVPPVVVTVTEPVAALPPMLKVAVIVVGLTTLTLVTVTPVGALTVAPEIKPLPVNVTGTVALCTPPEGLIEDSVGIGEPTVNGTGLLVPPAVWTLTTPLVAASPMLNVAVIVVGLTTLTLVTVMPLGAPTVAPAMNPVPVKVTGTDASCRPLEGLTEDNVGIGGLTVNGKPLLLPPAVMTVTEPPLALAPMLKVAVIVVGLTTLTLVTVMPLGAPTVAPAMNPVPVKVTGTDAPCTPPEGLTEDNVGIGGLTVNGKPLLLPPAVVTVTLPLMALAPMLKVAVIVVGLTTLTFVTVIPFGAPTVAPAMNPVPVKVTGTDAPCTPLEGLTEDNVGIGGLTVNGKPLLLPPAVVTVTLPLMALAPMLKVAVIVVGLTTLTFVTVIPFGAPTVAPAMNPVPVKVTGTDAPCTPLEGLTEDNVGIGGLTVNGKPLLLPPAVVTVTLPLMALAPMLKVAVIVVELTTLTAVTVIPFGAPTVAPAMNPVPVKVTGTDAPCTPLEGLTEDNVGIGGLTVNGTPLLVPPAVVTVTVPLMALPPVLKVAVIVVELATLTLVTVMPFGAPTVAPAMNPVPVKVTGTDAPCTPLEGLTEDNVGIGGLTVNGTPLLVPPAVVTVTVPLMALPPVLKVAVIVVELATLTLVTVMPFGAPTVAPAMNPVPVKITGTDAPCTPLEGLTEDNVGTGGLTVNGKPLLVPPAVVTVTVPLMALPPMLKVAVIVVELATLTLVTVTPLGAPTVAPAMNPVPVKITGTDVPCAPLDGLTEDNVGIGGLTVNGRVLLMPPNVVTLTRPLAAARLMLKVAVIVVALTTLTLFTVIPLGALTVAPEMNPVPVKVTGTDVPCTPLDGLTEDNVGTGGVTVNGRALLIPPPAVTVTNPL